MRMVMTFAAILMVAGFLGAPNPSVAETQAAIAKSAPTDISAQSQVRRTRPRIHVQPRYYPYRRYHSVYPLPYDIEYPGPYAKRACAARYVTEYRPSGTVVVPRMNCWWVRG